MGQQRPALLSDKREEGKAGRDGGRGSRSAGGCGGGDAAQQVGPLAGQHAIRFWRRRPHVSQSPLLAAEGGDVPRRRAMGRFADLNHGWWVGASPRRLWRRWRGKRGAGGEGRWRTCGVRVSLHNFSFLSFFPSYLFLAQPTHSTWHARATSLDAHLIVLDCSGQFM